MQQWWRRPTWYTGFVCGAIVGAVALVVFTHARIVGGQGAPTSSTAELRSTQSLVRGWKFLLGDTRHGRGRDAGDGGGLGHGRSAAHVERP